ncbi:MAG: hypothetical protein LBV54_07265 [Puniceicoccales bacterium]|nr:hypothetical protein [Puniceicoccales bacterium]
MNLRFFSLVSAAVLTLCAATAPTASAGKIKQDAIPNRGIFAIQIGGTEQEFYGRVDRVISVSFQEYTTGPLVVSEVVVDMAESNQLLRIYNARPVSLEATAQHATAAVSDTTQDAVGTTTPSTPSAIAEPLAKADEQIQNSYERMAGSFVVKTYPATTHAKTVEFSVANRKELVSFYKSFRDLYSGREVQVLRNGATVTGNAAEATSGVISISKLGGTIFTID